MVNCEHETVTRQKVTKDCLGEVFETTTDVCKNCGAELWDHAAQQKFADWLLNLDRSKRDRFTLQLSLTENTLRCLDKMITEFPGSDRAKVLRAMVMFFVERVASNQEWSDLVEQITEREVYKELTTGTKDIVKVHFSPFAMIDLQSWAGLVDMKPREFAENAALRIFAFYIEIDPVMRQFWLDNIRPAISMILKAA